jgi:hypothetical protein
MTTNRCRVPQPPGWHCLRPAHPEGTPCATEQDQGDCGTCGQSWQWHMDERPRHDYTPPGGAGGINVTPPRTDPPPTARVISGPFDPVLRQALIDAGIITPEMLRAAEQKIMVVTNQFREAMDDGEQQRR